MAALKNKEIVSVLNKLYPNPKTMLNYNNDYELLIAVVLSAQAQDIVVNVVTKPLFQKYPDFQSLSKANYEDVYETIRQVGLAKTKSQNIIKLANQVLENYKGTIPTNKEDLKTLAGVGDKTANVILAILFKENVMPVDTHIARFAKRLGIADEKDSANEVEKKLVKYFKGEDFRLLHHQIIYYGRNVCDAKKPKCEICEFTKFCIYYNSVKKEK